MGKGIDGKAADREGQWEENQKWIGGGEKE